MTSENDYLKALIRDMDDRLKALEGRARVRFSGARVYNNASFTHNNSGNWVTITFNSERYDTDAYHSTTSATGRLTIPADGYYMVGGHAVFTNSLLGDRRGIRIVTQAGTDIAHWVNWFPLADFVGYMDIATLAQRSKGDWMELQTYQNTGGNLDIISATAYTPEFWIYKIN